MNANSPDETTPSDSLGSPEHDRSGADVEEAVATAEAGSQVEAVHTPSDETAAGESRAQQIQQVDTATGGEVEGDPEDSPSPPQSPPAPDRSGAGG